MLLAVFGLGLGLTSYASMAKVEALPGGQVQGPAASNNNNSSYTPPPVAGGSKTATWEDHSTLSIPIGSETVKFFDNKIDDNLSYDSTASPEGDCDKAKVNSFSPGDGGNIPRSAILHVYAPASATNTNCRETTFKITFKNNAAFNQYFIWLDEGTIETSDGTAMTFVAGSNKKMFIDNGDGRSSDTKCKSYIKADPANPGNGTLFLSNQENQNTFDTGFTKNISGLDTGDFTYKDGCYVSKGLAIKLGHLGDAKKQAGSGTTSTSDNTDGTTELSCKFGWNPLNWLICGIVKSLVALLNGVDSVINGLLAVGTNGKTDGDPGEIFDLQSGKNASNYYEAWSSFRNIALGVIVVIALAAIISQMAGFEFIDAYTIRKVLPRLLAMSIIITLSWPILRFFVQLSNDLGFGVRALIEYPFRGSSNTIALNGGETAAVYLSTGAAMLALGPMGLLSFVATAVLAAFVAFLVLVIRQIVVILLVIVAPVAFACYILPNTQRFYKIWFDSFSGALLMFPIIAAMIATGRVFATVAIQDDSAVSSFIAFAAYFAPYFLIPYAFKMSGGAMSAISGQIQRRAQPGFGALSKYRANRASQNMQKHAEKFRTGDYSTVVPKVKGLNWLNNANQKAVDKLNTVGMNSTAGLKGGFGYGAKGEKHRELMRKRAEENRAKEAAMKGHGSSNVGNRFQVLLAENGGDYKKAEAEFRTWYGNDKNEYDKAFEDHDVNEMLTEAKAVVANRGGHSIGNAMAAYVEMANDGTAFRNVEDVARMAAAVSEGNATTTYEMMSKAGSISKQRGRPGLSVAQAHRANLAKAMTAAANGETVEDLDLFIDKATMSGAGGGSSWERMSTAPSREIRENMEHGLDIIKRYQTGDGSVSFEDAAQAAAVVQDMLEATDNNVGSVDNRKEVIDAVEVGGRKEMLQKFLESANTDQEPLPLTTKEGLEKAPVLVDDFGNVVTQQVEIEKKTVDGKTFKETKAVPRKVITTVNTDDGYGAVAPQRKEVIVDVPVGGQQTAVQPKQLVVNVSGGGPGGRPGNGGRQQVVVNMPGPETRQEVRYEDPTTVMYDSAGRAIPTDDKVVHQEGGRITAQDKAGKYVQQIVTRRRDMAGEVQNQEARRVHDLQNPNEPNG